MKLYKIDSKIFKIYYFIFVRFTVFIKDQKKGYMKTYIGTTRFNNETLEENRRYKDSRRLPGCIYGIGIPINQKYPINSLFFVVEMNNSTNTVEGIGLIKNCMKKDNYYNIYEPHSYNRYTYMGKYWVSREQVLHYIPTIVRILEIILFKGKSHYKRMMGISTITEQLVANWNENKKISNSSIIQKLNIKLQELFYHLFQLPLFSPNKKEKEK